MTTIAERLVLAYLAGVIDSDGTIGVRKSTYAMRVTKDSGQPTYFERVGVKQVTPQAIDLLHATFGGYRGMTRSSLALGKPLHAWQLSHGPAHACLLALRPYLRIKGEQADNALALRACFEMERGWPVVPIAPGEALVTATEFAVLVNRSPAVILHAALGSTIPSVRVGRNRMVPLSFVDVYRSRAHHPPRPQVVTDEMERIYQRARVLNLQGTSGRPGQRNVR